MPFEFDPAKSVWNKIKHGIDFVEAQALWMDEKRVEFNLPTLTEPRYQMLGLIHDRVWSAIITYRGENIRLISMRPAHRNERKLYHDD